MDTVWDTPRTILVPIELSEVSAAAFTAALALHGDPGTCLIVQHVLEASNLEFATALGYEARDAVETRARANAEETLRRLTVAEPPGGVEVQRLVSVGHTVFEILRIAAELEADLIVIAAPAHDDAEHALFGTTPEKILRGARCPVLVIPAGSRAAFHSATTVTPEGARPS